MAPEKAEKPDPPRRDAVAPVKMIVPRPRGAMRLAAHQEAAEACHFPDLGVDAHRRVDDREIHIRADVEHRDLDRADLGLDLIEQRNHRFFHARVGGEGARLMPVVADLLREGFQLLGVAFAAVDAGGEARGGKGAGDRAAGGVSGSDDDGCGVGHQRLSCCATS